jgi:hypothetical protein
VAMMFVSPRDLGFGIFLSWFFRDGFAHVQLGAHRVRPREHERDDEHDGEEYPGDGRHGCWSTCCRVQRRRSAIVIGRARLLHFGEIF